MSRAHLNRPITDSDGNVVPNTTVTVYDAGTNALISQPMYLSRTGSPVWDNPHITSDGFVDFYLDRPQSVRIGMQVPGAVETFVDDIPVLPAPGELVQAATPFRILNASVSGQFLQAGDPGKAAWVDAGDLANARPTPLNTIYNYNFSGAVMQGISITDPGGVPVAPSFPNVASDTKPSGWVFSAAVAVPTASRVTLAVPPQYWQERGTVTFLYKVISANAGVGAAMLHVAIDNDLIYVETPVVAELCNTWLVGYLNDIPVGTHRLTLQHRPGTDLTSQVLVGGILLQFGNNIPAHDHPGAGALSTRLGPGSTADYSGATSVGAQALSNGVNSTALGYDAQAGLNSLAAGVSSRGGIDSIAIGYQASTINRTGAVAVGKQASASADAAVALGSTALAQGPNSIAVGSGARTGVPADSVAVGANAQALAYRSVALGQGALVPVTHDYSIAIGANVTTTADHQARIGDAATTLVVPGSLRQLGGDALIGASERKIGFFGAAGVVKPTVTGSRGNNPVLADLLTSLANMGLIANGTTA